MLNLLNKIIKVCFDKPLFLTEIYNFILIYVLFCILIIVFYLRGFKTNYFCYRKIRFLYLYFKYTINN